MAMTMQLHVMTRPWRCKGSLALGHEISHFRLFQSPRSCHASPLILDIATNSLVFPHGSISPCIYAFFILPSISQFVVPCLIVFPFLPPSSYAPRCSNHSDFGATMFQDRSNCDADGLKPSLLASCFFHHPSTIHSFCRLCCVLRTPLVFLLSRSTSCLSSSCSIVSCVALSVLGIGAPMFLLFSLLLSNNSFVLLVRVVRIIGAVLRPCVLVHRLPYFSLSTCVTCASKDTYLQVVTT